MKCGTCGAPLTAAEADGRGCPYCGTGFTVESDAVSAELLSLARVRGYRAPVVRPRARPPPTSVPSSGTKVSQ